MVVFSILQYSSVQPAPPSKTPPSFLPFLRHFCSCFLLLVLILFWFHWKLVLTHNKILQHLDFCQASWLIKAVKLICLQIHIQEPTTLAMLFLFVQLGSSEEFKKQCNYAWLQSKTQQGSGRSKPPEACGWSTTQSSELELCESIPEMAPIAHACLQECQGKQWSLLGGVLVSHTFPDDKWGAVCCACLSLRLFFLLVGLF